MTKKIVKEESIEEEIKKEEVAPADAIDKEEAISIEEDCEGFNEEEE